MTDAAPTVAPPGLTRRVAWNAALWSAGGTLTTGAFLTYFVQELGAAGFQLAVFAALPELCALLGVVSRNWILRVGSHRRVWLVSTVVSRLVILGVPAIAMLDPGQSAAARWGMAGLLGIASALQGIAFTTYSDWVAGLAPSARWGRFFAFRNVATLLVQIIVPLGAAIWRDSVNRELRAAGGDTSELIVVYVVIFLAGTLLQVVSVLPLWSLPDIRLERGAGTALGSPRETRWWRNSVLRWLLAHSWLLAASNGLTQGVLIQYQYRHLKLEMWQVQSLFLLMNIVQITTTALSGRWIDRGYGAAVLAIGTLGASAALPCWLMSVVGPPAWVIGAYLCWGAFGAVNLAGPTLVLQHSPHRDASRELALFRQGAGFVAGLSGLLGGWLLERWLTESGGGSLRPFVLLMTISWAGRMLAALPVLGVPHRPAASSGPTDRK